VGIHVGALRRGGHFVFHRVQLGEFLVCSLVMCKWVDLFGQDMREMVEGLLRTIFTGEGVC
jgi:hypothetical protein